MYEAEMRREAFLEATVKEMRKAGLHEILNDETLASWLRTVWLEARGEEWGEEVTP